MPAIAGCFNLASPRGLFRTSLCSTPSGPAFGRSKLLPAILSNRRFSSTFEEYENKKTHPVKTWMGLLFWRPQGDSNPCCRRERAVS
jgi:hypothetical protein